MSSAIRVAATVVLLAPGLLVATSFLRDAITPPSTSVEASDPEAPTPIGPLMPGSRFTFKLPSGEPGFTGIMLLVATYHTRPRVAFEVCVRARCESSEMRVEDNSLLELSLPRRARGTDVTVTVRNVRGGSLAYWGRDGRPLFRAVLNRGWERPLARARQFYRAYGLDLFWPSLVVYGVCLLLITALAAWKARRDALTEPLSLGRPSAPPTRP